MQDKNIQTLEKLVDLIDTQKSVEQITEVFRLFIEVAESIKTGNEKYREEMMDMCHKKMSEMKDMVLSHEMYMDEMKANLHKLLMDEVASLKKTQKDDQNYLFDKITKVKEDVSKETERIDKRIDDLPEPEPPKEITPNEILNKVQSLDEGDRWDIKDVNGLEKELEKIRRMKVQGGFGGGNGLAMKNAVLVYDLSSSLNGVLKTFSLPAFWRVLTVDLSSFPNALRPTTDYTVDSSAMTITFTSQIEASTSLATGQTCIITYVSA